MTQPYNIASIFLDSLYQISVVFINQDHSRAHNTSVTAEQMAGRHLVQPSEWQAGSRQAAGRQQAGGRRATGRRHASGRQAAGRSILACDLTSGRVRVRCGSRGGSPECHHRSTRPHTRTPDSPIAVSAQDSLFFRCATRQSGSFPTSWVTLGSCLTGHTDMAQHAT